MNWFTIVSIESNMVLCAESYSGKTESDIGVKLEQMALVNQDYQVRLCHYPFEESLINYNTNIESILYSWTNYVKNCSFKSTS